MIRRVSAGLAFLLCTTVFGQTKPKFEVVEIKLNTSTDAAAFTLTPSGLFALRNLPITALVRRAWGRLPGPVLQNGPMRKDPIQGAPAWFDTDRVDLSGRAPAGTSEETAQLMLQSALEDRFQMKVSTEERTVPVFALTVARGGLKVAESNNTTAPSVCRPVPAKPKEVGAHVLCTNTHMSELASKLGTEFARAYIDKPVVDRTGVTGAYDFKFDWVSAPEIDKLGGVSIFGAIEKLGLKLESADAPSTTIVVHSAVRLSR